MKKNKSKAIVEREKFGLLLGKLGLFLGFNESCLYGFRQRDWISTRAIGGGTNQGFY